MADDPAEHALEFLLGFDGREVRLKGKYRMKFEVSPVEPTPERPHGLSYSLTLHDPEGRRIVGFDNAHRPPRKRSGFVRRPTIADHWHATMKDKGRPYVFKDVESLMDDFFDAAERALAERGFDMTVVSIEKRERDQ